MTKPIDISIQSNTYKAVNSFIKNVELDGELTLNVIKDPKIKEFDEPTFAKLLNTEFHNGIIELKVFSQLLSDAPDFARGFIGIAFRINDDDTKFESIYIRPTNGSADDQLRRNRTTQYFSYPDYKFDTFRQIAPGKYESYVDITIGEWIDFKVEVKDSVAKLYINNSKKPVLIVNDLKYGSDFKGSIGLWSEVGTDAYFKDLKITHL
jgi:hypothetical protein